MVDKLKEEVEIDPKDWDFITSRLIKTDNSRKSEVSEAEKIRVLKPKSRVLKIITYFLKKFPKL